MKILISGIGLAGPCLAYWLLKHGDGKHEIVMVEKAKSARTEGYIIELSGRGYEVMERMGLVEEMKKQAYEIGRIDSMDSSGKLKASLDYNGLLELMDGKVASLQRGVVAQLLLDALPLEKDKEYPNFTEEDKNRIKVLYGTEISKLSTPEDYSLSGENNVTVTFSDGSADNFDLVVGVDGTYSNVRNLAFGEGGIKDLNMAIVASEVTIPSSEVQQARQFIKLHSIPRRTLYTYSAHNGATVALFAVRGHIERETISTPALRKEFVRENLQDMRWPVAGEILDGIEGQSDVYATKVVQVRLDSWNKPGVVLVGDAAACPSLVSGEGAGLALTGAYVLAHALNTCQGNDIEKSLEEYEKLLMPYALTRQREAANRFVLAGFAPNTKTDVALVPILTRILNIKPIARLAVAGRSVGIQLPNY